MTFMVQDLLDFAQIKAGKFRKNIREFNILEAVNKVVSIQEKQAEDKGISLFSQFKNIINPMIKCDEGRVKQVLMGL